MPGPLTFRVLSAMRIDAPGPATPSALIAASRHVEHLIAANSRSEQVRHRSVEIDRLLLAQQDVVVDAQRRGGEERERLALGRIQRADAVAATIRLSRIVGPGDQAAERDGGAARIRAPTTSSMSSRSVTPRAVRTPMTACLAERNHREILDHDRDAALDAERATAGARSRWPAPGR